jgi:pimeloyl-ACP methyl ester carboxylesterase
LNGLHLFRELTRYPSLGRLLRTPVPILAVLGVRDPLMASPARVREVVRLSPEHLTVALIDKAAHAVNFSHPEDWRARSNSGWTMRSPKGPASLTGCVRVPPRGVG